jgi:hypothetical protein
MGERLMLVFGGVNAIKMERRDMSSLPPTAAE